MVTEVNVAKTSRWRRLVAAFLVIVSCALAPLSVAAIWVRNEILSTDRYVANVTPLASNPAIQAAVAHELVTTLFASVDVRARAAAALPKRAGFLAGPLTDGLEQYAHEAAAAFLASDQFKQLWRSANERAHAEVRDVLTGGGKVVSIRGGNVTLDLAAVALQLRAQLKQHGIGIFDAVPITRLALKYELFNAKQLKHAQRAIDLLDKLSWLLPLLMLASLGGGLWLSPNRRRTLMRWGLGVAFSVAVLGAGLAVGRSAYLDAVSGPQLPRDAAAAVFDTLVRFLRTGLRLALTIGIVVAVAAWLTGTTKAASRLRNAARDAIGGLGNRVGDEGVGFGSIGRWVAHHRPALRVAGVLCALVALLFWHHPRGSTVLELAVLVIVFLAVVEFVARAAIAAAADAANLSPNP